jgi:hypothetical protein
MYEFHRKVFFVCVIKDAVNGPNCCPPLVKGGAVCGPHHGLRGVHLGGLGPRRPPRSYPVPGTVTFLLEFPLKRGLQRDVVYLSCPIGALVYKGGGSCRVSANESSCTQEPK